MKNRNCIFIIFCLIISCNLNIAYTQIGELTISGNMSLISGSTYLSELKDLSGAGVGHDHIIVGGDVTLSGTLDIDLAGYVPDIKDSFEIITYQGELSGQFNPELAPTSSATGLGAIGIAVTGAPIFNDQERANMPLDVETATGFDYASGHVGPGGYHYHIESSDVE